MAYKEQVLKFVKYKEQVHTYVLKIKEKNWKKDTKNSCTYHLHF